MSRNNERRKTNQGRRDTDIPEAQVAQLEFRMGAAEALLREHKDILLSVADSLQKLVLIETHTKAMAADVAEVKAALHGTQSTKGLFTRLSDLETKSSHHSRLWLYVGGSVGAGIVWGISQIFYHIWEKTTGS